MRGAVGQRRPPSQRRPADRRRWPASGGHLHHHAGGDAYHARTAARAAAPSARPHGGREFSLAVRGRNVLIAGDAKSGKSWVAGLLCEQLILLGLCVCVIDPEGDYRTLEALPGVTVLGGDDPPPTPRELAKALQYPDRSVVIDLSRRPQAEKIDYIRAVLPTLNALRTQTGFPHRIVVDEAHYFLHDADAVDLLDLDGIRFVFHAAPELFRTTWFVESLLTELAVALVVRTRRPFSRSRPGTLLMTTTAGVAIVAVALPYVPGVSALGFVPLTAPILVSVFLIAGAYVAATELGQLWFFRRARP
jgi:hypothetical protein